MLKYTIHPRQFDNQDNELKILKILTDEVYDEYADDKFLGMFFAENVDCVKKDMSLYTMISRNIERWSDDDYETHKFDFNPTLKVLEVNNDVCLFTAYIDKYIKLRLATISLSSIIRGGNLDEKDRYLYFYFNDSHLINSADSPLISVTYRVAGNDGEIVLSEAMDGLEYINNTALRLPFDVKVGYIDDDNKVNINNIIYDNIVIEDDSFVIDNQMVICGDAVVGYVDKAGYFSVKGDIETYYIDGEQVKKLGDDEFSENINEHVFSIEGTEYKIQGIKYYLNDDAIYRRHRDELNDLLSALFGVDYSQTDDDLVGNLNAVDVRIPNFIFDDPSYVKIYVDKPVYTLKLPLIDSSDTNLMQSEAITTSFVNVEKQNAINPIVDMERDVYHPIIRVCGNNGSVGYESVYRIKFNLHFRNHRGDDWIAKNESYWNGTYIEDGTLKIMTPVSSTGGYFSYKDYSQQSDLLSYLNFNNNDVKYQRNRLKKSFLRLSFYDSMKTFEQRLLYYSTMYMDTGKLFNKFVNGIETSPMLSNSYGEDDMQIDEVFIDKVGVKAANEPYGSAIIGLNNDAIEEKRLSSQFVVTDKYNSQQSSEGFYVYLWKENNQMELPQDLYMKVEFNHAGYGRTIPFYMPYKDSGNGNRIKKFEDIVNDWNGENGGYGIQKYIRYSYIHLRYQYCKELDRYVYYLDNNTYGNDLKFKDNEIVLNLYETKISAESKPDSSRQSIIKKNKALRR